jgi:serine/threonine-protein phosphatase 2A regulatory subunit B''
VLFAKLQQGDRLGRVSIMALFNYVMRKVWLHQTRIGLSLYDITGQGFLRESDLGKLNFPFFMNFWSIIS